MSVLDKHYKISIVNNDSEKILLILFTGKGKNEMKSEMDKSFLEIGREKWRIERFEIWMRNREKNEKIFLDRIHII